MNSAIQRVQHNHEPTSSNVANFIIGGTEKAGTTSVFSYLSEHPEVSGSLEKETDFFRHNPIATAQETLAAYAQHFRQGEGSPSPIVMEASPGYLGAADRVAPQIGELIPDMKMLFILRNPIDRLYSSFNFHKNRLDLDANLEFDDYIDRCLQYQQGADAASLGMDDWYLKTMEFGCYSKYLRTYFSHFDRSQVQILFFEDLQVDVQAFMSALSDFLGISNSFWADYQFEKKNSTFSGKNRALHKLAMYANDRAERVLRQRPALKSRIVSLYKSVNQSQEGYDLMPEACRTQLSGYYLESNRALINLIDSDLPDSWN